MPASLSPKAIAASSSGPRLMAPPPGCAAGAASDEGRQGGDDDGDAGRGMRADEHGDDGAEPAIAAASRSAGAARAGR